MVLYMHNCWVCLQVEILQCISATTLTPVYLLGVMGVVQLLHFNMHWTVRQVALSSRDCLENMAAQVWTRVVSETIDKG